MATDFEAIAGIFYGLWLIQVLFLMILVLYVWTIVIYPWMQRGKIWKRLVDNSRGALSTQSLNSWMNVYTNDAGKTWMMAVDQFGKAGKNVTLNDVLRRHYPNIANIEDPSEQHQKMRLLSEEPYYPFFVTMFLTPTDMEKQ